VRLEQRTLVVKQLQRSKKGRPGLQEGKRKHGGVTMCTPAFNERHRTAAAKLGPDFNSLRSETDKDVPLCQLFRSSIGTAITRQNCNIEEELRSSARFALCNAQPMSCY
jgi:hypothetical protein